MTNRIFLPIEREVSSRAPRATKFLRAWCLVGINIDNACTKAQLDQLVPNKLPSEIKNLAA